MFFELVATIVAGLAGAGVMMALNRLTGNRLPRWLIPVAAGAAMLFATIASEYSWYGRTRDNLPDGLQVVHAVENRALYRPWTYVVPYIARFMALDTGAVRINSQDQAVRLVDLYLYGRWRRIQALQVMVNCETGQRADPMESTGGTETVWRDTDADDPIVTATCKD